MNPETAHAFPQVLKSPARVLLVTYLHVEKGA
jgi:hypothetical protein